MHKPLWVCDNAMIVDHECKYVKCNSCYQHPGRTSRQNKGKGHCNHASLSKYDDIQYYKEPGCKTYEDEDNWPRFCVLCKKEIVVY